MNTNFSLYLILFILIQFGCDNVLPNYSNEDQNPLELECNVDVCLQLEFGNNQNEIIIHTKNVKNISGFQFKLNNVIIDSFTSGRAIDEGFSITNSNSTYLILGFSMMGGFIPIGDEALLKLNFSNLNSNSICISNPIFAGTGNSTPELFVNTGDCLYF